jgi:hypothetical protein
MTGMVKVMLTIAALVDGEYSPDEHAKDIIASARHTFSACDVKVEKVELATFEETDDPMAQREATKPTG